MSRLSDIAIRVEPGMVGAPPAVAGGLGGGVAAILTELVSLLDRLTDSQTPAAIDLRSLPMSPQDRVELKRALGEGEVRATLDAQGLSTVCETRIAGVWWVEHRDPQGELVAELLEVTRVPDILVSAPDDIAAGAQTLRRQIATLIATPTISRSDG
jgi:hydrogenase-1 operon protein HyaF